MGTKLVINTGQAVKKQLGANYIILKIQNVQDVIYLKDQIQKALKSKNFEELELWVEKNNKQYLEIIEVLFKQLLTSGQSPLVRVYTE